MNKLDFFILSKIVSIMPIVKVFKHIYNGDKIIRCSDEESDVIERNLC